MPSTSASTIQHLAAVQPCEHSAVIDHHLVVTFRRHGRGRMAERWTPRRPAELTVAQARRYQEAAEQARRVLGVAA